MHLALKHGTEGSFFQRLFYLLTRARLVTSYAHAGIVVDGFLFHTNLGNGLHREVFDRVGLWTLFEIPDNADMRALFAQHAGTPYDWFSLLAFVLPWRVRDRQRLYCYEWCWMAMTGESPGFRVTPEMLLVLAQQQNKEAL